jgi:hypothetical protein
MAARARNLAHRSGVLVSVGAVTFAVTFGLLLWFTRAERDALQRVPATADTVDLARAAGSLRRQQYRADSMLADLPVPRRYAVRPTTLVVASGDSVPGDSAAAPVTADEAPLVVDTSRVAAQLPDAMRVAAAALTARLERAQNAPLAASWRALAADPMLQQDVRVRALADSLSDAERARNEYDAVGGVDPIYLELSSRVTAYGRGIERAALQRLASLTRPPVSGASGVVVAAPAGPSPSELARRFADDSARYARATLRRARAQQAAESVTTLLVARRTEALERDASRARAQRRVDALAPPLAMLLASGAAAIGLSLLLALLLELQAPRVSDEYEVVTQARVPLLLSIRASDASSSDALSSAFSQLVFDLEPMLSGSPTLIVVSDDAGLASRTAARIAERLGYDGRRVRVVSPRQGTARSTLRTRSRLTPTATRSVLVQPERSQGVAWTGEHFLEVVQDDTVTVRSGNLGDVRTGFTAEGQAVRVLLVVRIGSTPTAWIRRARSDVLSEAGAAAIGVVAWAPDIDDGDPVHFALDSALQRALEPAPAAGR